MCISIVVRQLVGSCKTIRLFYFTHTKRKGLKNIGINAATGMHMPQLRLISTMCAINQPLMAYVFSVDAPSGNKDNVWRVILYSE